MTDECPTPEQTEDFLKNLTLKQLWGVLKLAGKRDIAYETIRRCQSEDEVNAVVGELEREFDSATPKTRRRWRKAADRMIQSLQAQTTN